MRWRLRADHFCRLYFERPPAATTAPPHVADGLADDGSPKPRGPKPSAHCSIARRKDGMFKSFIHQSTLALAVLSLSCALADAQERDQKFTLPHITVTGTSFVEVRPDIATFSLGVVNERPTAAEAESENARAAASAIAGLKRVRRRSRGYKNLKSGPRARDGRGSAIQRPMASSNAP